VFRIHERSKMTRYRSIRPGYCASVGTLSSFPHSPPPPALHLRPIRMPHVHTSFEYVRVFPAQSRPPPLLCVNCIIFTPNTFRPHASRHGPPGSTGQIAHVHRKSPPGHGQPAYPSVLPQHTPQRSIFYVSLLFFPKVTYISHLTQHCSSQFKNHVKRTDNYNCSGVIF